MRMLQRHQLAYLGKVIWIYTKYQLLTKLLLFFGIYPIFKIISKLLIESSGQFAISSGDYIHFLFSFQGLGLLVVTLLVLLLLIAFDINAFIIMSALIKEQRINLTVRQLLLASVSSLKSLLSPSGLIVMLYIAIVIPLVGVGLSVSVMKDFKIPNFITDVIFNNPTYYSLYLFSILLLTTVTINYTFFFHFLIIDQQPISLALKKSSQMMKRHWKAFIKEFIVRFGLSYAILVIVSIGILYVLLFLTQELGNVLLKRFLSIFTALSSIEIADYFALMTVPLVCYRLTNLFYKFNAIDGYPVRFKQDIKTVEFSDNKKENLHVVSKGFIGIIFSVILLFNITLSTLTSTFFDDMFKVNRKIEVIAHRGGGDLAAENSILGMEKAAKKGADWSEIDVQRTKDGQYIINHDPTFKKLTGNPNTSAQLTLDEIKQLKIHDLFNEDGQSQPIPTLAEYLDASKGKMRLFIELKGSTADKQMADEVVKLVKQRKMEKDVAILSLDYNLISYLEERYPNMDTGYLYFFSLGDISKLKADFLIMEEQEVSDEKLDKLHQFGKKAIVWTVNTDESIEKFVLSDVDGIITDHVPKVKAGLKYRDHRDDMQIIIDSILK